MEITGRIIKVGDERSGESKTTHSPWKCQDFVVEYFANPRDMFSKHMRFTVFGEDRLKAFDIKEGNEYKIEFDVDAHEKDGNWYNDIRAYRVTLEKAQGQTYASVPNGSNLI